MKDARVHGSQRLASKSLEACQAQAMCGRVGTLVLRLSGALCESGKVKPKLQ